MKLQTEPQVTIPCNLNISFEREWKSYIYIETASQHLHEHKIEPCYSLYRVGLSHRTISTYLLKFQKPPRHIWISLAAHSLKTSDLINVTCLARFGPTYPLSEYLKQRSGYYFPDFFINFEVKTQLRTEKLP